MDTTGLPSIGLNDASTALALLAADPGLGGLVVAGPPCEARDLMLAMLRTLSPFSPWRRLPVHATEEQLVGGLDLATTLAAKKPMRRRGLLADVAGGVLVVAMAERVAPVTAATIAAALDAGAGMRLIVLDEGQGEEEAPASLVDRCAFRLAPAIPDPIDPATVAVARVACQGVSVEDEAVQSVCAAALALGIDSARAPLHALRAARALAALDGRDRVMPDDVATAARLVLGWRATRIPSTERQDDSRPDAVPEAPESGDEDKALGPLDDIAVEAAEAGIPAGLLAALQAGGAARGKAGGRATARLRQASRHGRPIGARRGLPRDGARLALFATLQAAVPWQSCRRATGDTRLVVLRDDLRINRTKPRAASTTIFAVDASGSAAAARLSEAKGAVERLLSECYVRRDEVAVIGFRGERAELLLPPTRSLTRAKRALSQLPGGGGTPLSAGLLAAASLADAVRRAGRAPAIVVLTDGRANVARDGTPGRARADAEAREAGRRIAGARVPSLLIDTATRPQSVAQAIAAAMGARYVPLPQAAARDIVRAVRQVG